MAAAAAPAAEASASPASATAPPAQPPAPAARPPLPLPVPRSRSSLCTTFIYWDPCGLACVVVAVATVLVVDFTTTFLVIDPWFGPVGLPFVSAWIGRGGGSGGGGSGGAWPPSLAGALHAGGFQIVILLILASYFRAVTTDPGSVPRGTATEADRVPPDDDPDAAFKPKRRYCSKCRCIKPPRAHHCSTCQRCVNKMDHHCPWVNNCVGSNNFKFFLLFLFWTFLGALYACLMAAARLAACWAHATLPYNWQLHLWQRARGMAVSAPVAASRLEHFKIGLAALAGSDRCELPSIAMLITLVVSAVLAIFFVFFTACMVWDQYQGMTSDVTGVEYMKQWEEAPRGLRAGLEDACGEPFSLLRWLLPVQLPPQSSSLYLWTPEDDPDAYDPRDPAVKKHFRNLERAIQRQHQIALAEAAAAAGGGGTDGEEDLTDDDSGDEAGDGGGGRERAPATVPVPAPAPAPAQALAPKSKGAGGKGTDASKGAAALRQRK